MLNSSDSKGDNQEIVSSASLLNQSETTELLATIPTTSDKLEKQSQEDEVGERVSRIMSLLRTVSTNQHPTPNLASDMNVNLKQQTIQTPSSSISQSSAVETNVRSERVQILKQECEIQEKNRLINSMKTEISRLKDEMTKETSAITQEAKSKMTTQKRQLESMIRRGQESLDKAIKEREDLFAKYEKLSHEFQLLERKLKSKIEGVEEAHVQELKRRKDMWEASEKLKRDRWLQEKSKVIKEQVMKGFEPEIQRLITQHKSQMLRQEEQLKMEFARERQVLLDEHQVQLGVYREKIAGERRKAADEERELARQRYQKQLERDEIELQQLRRKASAQFEEEKDRLLGVWREEKKAEMEVWRGKCDSLEGKLKDLLRTRDQDLKQVKEEHDNEVKRLRENLSRENEEWRQVYVKQVQKESEKRERELLKKLISERNEEIEKVVKRLEEETYSCSNSMHLEHRKEIERMDAEHKDQMRALTRQLNNAMEKVIGMEDELKRVEDEGKQWKIAAMKARNELEARDSMMQEQKSELERLRLQRADLKSTLEKEMAHESEIAKMKIQSLEKSLTGAMLELERSKKETAEKVKAAQSTKVHELETLEQTIAETLSKKDAEIVSVRSKLEDMQIRNGQLESLLDQQRDALIRNM